MPATKSNRLLKLVDSWELSLDSAGKSADTIRAYTDTAKLFAKWFEGERDRLDAEGRPVPPLSPKGIQAAHIRRFLIAERDRTSPASAAHHYRNLRVWCSWMVTEDIVPARTNPMTEVEAPHVPKKVIDALSDDEIKALHNIVGGKSFEARRDTVIFDIFQDTGVRVSGLAGLRVSEDPDKNDVLLSKKLLRIVKKGGDQMYIPIGRITARDIDRYLRVREDHPAAPYSSSFLLGKRGAMTKSGIQQMLKRRAKQAGIKRSVHPHMFRHGFAAEWVANGGNVTDLMQIAGWSSLDMVRKYTEHAAAQQAWAAHQKLSPTDRRRAS